ncbi:hypothetical protein [Candidatus Nitrospira bockiana]
MTSALLSAAIPGLGQLLKRQGRHAALIFAITVVLVALAWALGRMGGPGADVFFLMIIVLPWWMIQAYDAYLTGASGSPSLRSTLRTISKRAHDIRFLGALFLLTAATDFYIIVANPEYALTVFCSKPTGLLGVLVKAQSPTLHVLIGYGFLGLRRWSLFLYLAYAAFGLLNATANFACFGYGRVRLVFLLTLIGFTAYVLLRRRCFGPALGRL